MALTGIAGSLGVRRDERSAEELRVAILAAETHAHGSFHGTGSQLSTFAGQLRTHV